MPGGALGRFLQHPGATEHAWWHRLVHDLAVQHTHAAIVVALVMAVAAAVLVARRAAGASAVRRGRWLHIDPPAQPPADGAVALWRQLSPLLTARPSLAGRRPPAALEWTADPGRLRVGLWCSRTVGLNAVAEAVQTAWPGAQVTTSDPPALLARSRTDGGPRRVSAARVRLSLPPWYPFETGDAKTVAGDEPGSGDPLRGLLAALASPPTGGSAVLQVLARPASRRCLRKAHQAARALRTGRQRPSAQRPTRHSAHARGSEPADPTALADARTITNKLTDAPLFQVEVRIAATSPAGRAGRRARAAWLRQVAGALGLYSGQQRLLLTRSHRRGPGRAIDRRRPGRGFLAGVHELAALAHLPAQPSRYGLTVAPARAVAASTEVTHA